MPSKNEHDTQAVNSVRIQSTKAIVTVSEMARMLKFSRSRLYQLIGTVMPFPVYDIITRRPVFTEDLQRICLEVRRRNCGINGEPILFYARAPRAIQPTRRTSNPRPKKTMASSDAIPQWLMDSLSGLGLSVTQTLVKSAMREIYPQGISGVDQGEVIRSVFLKIRSQNQSGNVGR